MQFPYETKFRLIRPKGERKSFSIQYKVEDSWQTYTDEVTESIARSYKDQILDFSQANERFERVLKTLYRERDKVKPIVVVRPGNVQIVERFIAETYNKKRVRRLAPRSFETEKYALLRVVNDLGNVAIDGDVDDIQDTLDELYKNSRGSHRKRVTAANRIRKWLALELVMHMPSLDLNVLYINENQVKDLISHIKHPVTKVLAGFLFYTGLRLGEAFAIGSENLIRNEGVMTLKVTSQMYADGNIAPTKTRSSRKALVIPGGEAYIEKWMAIDKAKNRSSKHSSRIKEAASAIGFPEFYLHCLRHSYCVYLISKGCTIDWVAQSAGHSREVCERYYSTHTLTDESVFMMSRILNNAKTS